MGKKNRKKPVPLSVIREQGIEKAIAVLEDHGWKVSSISRCLNGISSLYFFKVRRKKMLNQKKLHPLKK
jgi:site-specific recombinase XerD